MLTVKDIREKFLEKLQNSETVTVYGDTKTIELLSETFVADEPYIFMKPNHEYISREISWYNSQSLNVYDIPGKVPEIWKKVADKDGLINSNYGWCIYSEENGSQYQNCLKQLLEDNSSRRACMIYTRPSMQYDYCSKGMSDFMCTYSTQQFIRDGKLVYIVYMRSNDAIFGYRNDWAWHHHVALKLIKDLAAHGVVLEEEPMIIWNAGSLHVYERHFDKIHEHFSE